MPRIHSHLRPVISEDRAPVNSSSRTAAAAWASSAWSRTKPRRFNSSRDRNRSRGVMRLAAHVAAGVGALGAEVPQLGLLHHHREHGERPVGVAGGGAQRIEPAPHVGAGDVTDAHLCEEGREVAGDQVAVGLAGGGLPAPGVAAQELVGEVAEQRPVLALGAGGLDDGGGLLARLGGGEVVGGAEDGPRPCRACARGGRRRSGDPWAGP